MKSAIKVYADRRMAIILLFGFSAGIPLGLSGGTLQAWMASEKVDLSVVGVFSLVALPYSLKFLWAPLMDGYVPPFLGRRRGWLLVAQAALILTAVCMAFTNPVASLGLMASLAFGMAFFSASQDIAADAYRTEILEREELGAGAGSFIVGYRIAMLVTGSVALVLADYVSWRAVYLIMAGVMLVGLVTTLLAPEPRLNVGPPRTFAGAVVMPFVKLLKRKGIFEIALFTLTYRLPVIFALSLMTPFLLDLGFSKTEIGAISKAGGYVTMIVGALVGGVIVSRIGIRLSLWVFGVLQGCAGLLFAWLAFRGHSYPLMLAATLAEQFCSGLGTAAYAAFIMSVCDKQFTATHYALLTSLMALTVAFASAPTGYLVQALGWGNYFVVSALTAVPGLLLLTRYGAWECGEGTDEGEEEEAAAFCESPQLRRT